MLSRVDRKLSKTFSIFGKYSLITLTFKNVVRDEQMNTDRQ